MERAAKQAEPVGAGYLCFQSGGESDGEWAGLLVVSPNGLPLEFLYSGPLVPTPVQAILYQQDLERELRLSLVRSLRKGLRSRLLLAAAHADEVVPMLVEELGCPVLVLRDETSEWPAPPPPAAEALRKRLEEVVGIGEPLGRTRAALAYVVEYERTR